MCRLKWVIFLLLFSGTIGAQKDSILIEYIFIVGNKQTCDDVIMRELVVAPGQKVPYIDLPELIRASEINLNNTRLFNSVRINFKETAAGCEWVITVDEAWYVYPVVIFDLADRNFNVWWREQERALDRVNIGIQLDHFNLTGHKDQLKATAQIGYTHKYEFEYDYPFLNAAGTWGLNMAFLYRSNKEVGYRTENNKLEFYQEDDFIYHRRRFTVDVYHRPRFRQVHNFKVEFYNNDISTSVVENYNPDFFNGQRNRIRYFVLQYTYVDNQLDHFNYPLNGYYLEGTIRKEGVGIFNEVNMLSVTGEVEYYTQINDRWAHGHKIKGRAQLQRDNPGYYHYTALGYSDNQVRGYELYVIDGLDYIFSEHRINFQIFDKSWTFGKWMFLEQFKHPRLQLFAALAFENGFVNSPYFNSDNPLANRWLVGGGPSLDLVIYNHFLFKVDYSINGLGEKNLFLHFNISF